MRTLIPLSHFHVGVAQNVAVSKASAVLVATNTMPSVDGADSEQQQLFS
jgi:hypothetical protein